MHDIRKRNTARQMQLLSCAFVCGVSMAAPVAAQESYPLLCINGGSYLWKVEKGIDANRNITSTVDVPFRHGESRSSLNPGQCTWSDRPLNADEPSVIRFQWTIGPNGSVISGYEPGPNGWRDAKLRYVVFSCDVYNDRAGHLIATKCDGK